MSERDELFQLMLGRTTTKAVERILAAGYRKLEPVWADELSVNDGEYEYTISSDCDGSNVKRWRRTPRMVAEQPPGVWQEVDPK